MKKEFLGVSGFLAALLMSCTMSNAAESILLADAAVETEAPQAKAEETKKDAEAAPAAAVPQVQYVEYESRIDFSGHIWGSWWDGFTREGNAGNITQAWLTAERAIDTDKYGADWGFRVDTIYGTDGAEAQCYGDGGFDGKWGVSGDGYGAAIFQAYAEVGVHDFSMIIGKFETTLGYECLDETEELFNSHSYMYEHEPMTHTGILGTYDVTEKLSFNFGVTTGNDNSFEGRNDDYGILFGTTYQFTDRFSVSYAGMWNRVTEGATMGFDYFDVFGGEETGVVNEYMHTIAASWDITDRLNYTFVTNYGSMSDKATDAMLYGQFGIANYLAYTLTDKITIGTRFEWFHQWAEEDSFYTTDFDEAEYYALSAAMTYRPTEHIMVRPEVRYDWVEEGDDDEGFSGGVGFGFIF